MFSREIIRLLRIIMKIPMMLIFIPMLICFTNRSEEHTSELQSLAYLVCRLLLEKKKKRRSPLNPEGSRACRAQNEPPHRPPTQAQAPVQRCLERPAGCPSSVLRPRADRRSEFTG